MLQLAHAPSPFMTPEMLLMNCASMQSSLGAKLPGITPNAKCKLRLLKLERIKDWLLMEEEFVSNQERLKPQEERNEEDRTKACPPPCLSTHIIAGHFAHVDVLAA